MPTPIIHPASLSNEDLLKQCGEKRAKRSGPGGQHRNKVETAVILTHTATGITAEAGERRSQRDNRSKALKRLRFKLAVDFRTIRNLEEPASELWQSRCQAQKIVISINHRDYPTLLAEALDVITQYDYDLKVAAGYFNCTLSQLIKFLKKHTQGMTKVNAERKARGQQAYH